MTTDPFDDDDYDEEAEAKIRAVMAPLVTTTPLEPKPPSKRKGITDAERAEEADRIAWDAPLPETSHEAKFVGNLGHRFLQGITTRDIQKMHLKERVNASRTLFDMRQLLLDKPTVNFNFAERQSVQAVLRKAQAELERREQARVTVDVTPTEGGENG